ncbi:hypothetical protein CLAFUW4_14452 [Fulvia fulva]|uniref:Heterokaryon incompatibility domain-containing protein n=1 Tax=Passalora fulva TaxID=5499 RepID=A0A9Q8UWC2_PASFU|nr:uncharacterized protein CLAFUR5_14284 [Fulvia fulva]KAK4609440.1 hypothetical protein CLAFUR4_14447 [Fulvia fulva]KAK4609598.1 hypothetical protein CLAFUR0_14449 [Fulvia fulva]UJO24835.1 hypothetical protein CLAFUR5_14284 [Fulvia fulva]WPV22605.1 hypothetical protein CLAFUW4_14452 [Fulvia fulva]WPV37395.1 hypothetical protein CLAFUW7_14456 [Fulvia fulva]
MEEEATSDVLQSGVQNHPEAYDTEQLGDDEGDSQTTSLEWEAECSQSDGDLESSCIPYAGVHIDPENEIRVLVLDPGDFADELRGSLVVQRLRRHDGQGVSDDLDYEALSYAWGCWEHHEWILLADHIHPTAVTRNLWLALRRLRMQEKPRRLWIDQMHQPGWLLREKPSGWIDG